LCFHTYSSFQEQTSKTFLEQRFWNSEGAENRGAISRGGISRSHQSDDVGIA